MFVPRAGRTVRPGRGRPRSLARPSDTDSATMCKASFGQVCALWCSPLSRQDLVRNTLGWGEVGSPFWYVDLDRNRSNRRTGRHVGVIDGRRGAIRQALVQTLLVVEAEVRAQTVDRGGNRGVVLQVHLLILD